MLEKYGHVLLMINPRMPLYMPKGYITEMLLKRWKPKQQQQQQQQTKKRTTSTAKTIIIILPFPN